MCTRTVSKLIINSLIPCKTSIDIIISLRIYLHPKTYKKIYSLIKNNKLVIIILVPRRASSAYLRYDLNLRQRTLIWLRLDACSFALAARWGFLLWRSNAFDIRFCFRTVYLRFWLWFACQRSWSGC